MFVVWKKSVSFVMMKQLTILVSILVAGTLSIFAMSTVISSFTAQSVSNTIKIEWRTSSEDDIDRFELERSSSTQPFRVVAILQARGGASQYSFMDDEAINKTDAETATKGQFTYRIKIVASDDSFTYSNTTTVTHSVSTVRRTWGMIKEMFR